MTTKHKYHYIALSLEIDGVANFTSYKLDYYRNLLSDYTEAEQRIYYRLGQHIEHYFPETRVTFSDISGLLAREISKEVRERLAVKRLRTPDGLILDEIPMSADKDGKATAIDLLSEQATEVYDDTLNEKIVLLAKDDEIKRYILFGWSDGKKSSEIARELALLNGKSFNTYEMYIKRYKRYCKSVLSNAA